MDIITLVNIIILLVIIALLILAIEKNELLHSAILLGATSALLGIVFFVGAAPIAAVFELVVCAGLITVLFISAITLTKAGEESK
jgi:NADH-quinone oxidoreductase subunit J